MDADDEKCCEPCDPNSGCGECADYWQRMEREGFWNMEKHEWTPRGWREIIK